MRCWHPALVGGCCTPLPLPLSPISPNPDRHLTCTCARRRVEGSRSRVDRSAHYLTVNTHSSSNVRRVKCRVTEVDLPYLSIMPSEIPDCSAIEKHVRHTCTRIKRGMQEDKSQADSCVAKRQNAHNVGKHIDICGAFDGLVEQNALKYRTRGRMQKIEGVAVGTNDNDAATGTAHNRSSGRHPPGYVRAAASLLVHTKRREQSRGLIAWPSARPNSLHRPCSCTLGMKRSIAWQLG